MSPADKSPPIWKHLVATLMLVAMLAACSDSEPKAKGGPDFAACGFPEPDRKVDPTLFPPSYLLDGEAIVGKTDVVKKRFLGALHVPRSVNESFDLYKEAVAQTTLDVIQEDNEGFEAELYLKGGDDLGSIQIRGSRCDDAVIVYVNLPLERPKASGTKEG